MPNTTIDIRSLRGSILRWIRLDSGIRITSWLGIAIAAAFVLWTVWHSWFASTGHRPVPTGESATDSAPAVCELTAEKLARANLHFASVDLRSLREYRTVPGKITYDSARRLDVTAPVASIVGQVLVEPGQAVEAGQPLVMLSSTAVGLARDEVLKRTAELAVARKRDELAQEIRANVQQLGKQLESRPLLAELERNLAGVRLADYREKLLGAYSRLLLAESALSGADSGGSQGLLSKRLVEERRSVREVAAAQFASACESALFESELEADQQRAQREQTERLLRVSRESLASLLGPLAAEQVGNKQAASELGTLSEITILAPMAGTIQERAVVQSARLDAGDPMFVLADTSNVWVSAEIHERDWRALDFAIQARLTITIPALGDQTAEARVRFIGARVSEETHSVPLIAELDNADGRLRPGMFVWVEVPIAEERQLLAIPTSALMRHENRSFVFVPESEERFRRVDVVTGLTARDYLEVVSGLQVGQRVVDQGAALLKSELLLEREE
ncbi:MAG: efflux RND transporter periplasmic adaptor subunit [Planctomycetes bacterium]|nr:efflux RND transporter periplasmic adaptor subunit [Planctomycetota bacterium]